MKDDDSESALFKVSGGTWNQQYQHGEWEFLSDIKEVARDAVQSAFIGHLQREGDVIDCHRYRSRMLSCGEVVMLMLASFDIFASRQVCLRTGTSGLDEKRETAWLFFYFCECTVS